MQLLQVVLPIYEARHSSESFSRDFRRWKWRAIFWMTLKWNRSTRLKRRFRNGGSCVDLWRTRSGGFVLRPISRSDTKLRLCAVPTRSHFFLSFYLFFIYLIQPKKKKKNIHNVQLKAYRNSNIRHIRVLQFCPVPFNPSISVRDGIFTQFHLICLFPLRPQRLWSRDGVRF